MFKNGEYDWAQKSAYCSEFLPAKRIVVQDDKIYYYLQSTLVYSQILMSVCIKSFGDLFFPIAR